MSRDPRIDEILDFWFGPPPLRPRELWFQGDPATDEEIRRRFARDLERAAAGELEGWSESPEGALALILLLDQFSRNVHRDRPEAFASDGAALAAALDAVDSGLDRELSPLQRAFLYMPLMHSEDPAVHERSVALFDALAAEAPQELAGACRSFLDHAHKHKEVIDRFGRYPHRNQVLGRDSTEEELAFLKERGRGF